MGKDSSISWTDHTFNPWWGCTKCSPGCQHCYAESWARRTGYGNIWGEHMPRRFFGPKHWQEPMHWNTAAARAGETKLVFCGSMCDYLEQHTDPEINAQMDLERDMLFERITATPNLIWLMLTKRPHYLHTFTFMRTSSIPRNIWWGITAEDQHMLDERYPTLDSETHYLYPPTLFISAEPLLGPLDLGMYLEEIDCGDEEHTWWTHPPDWAIIGGESGYGAREMKLEWALDLIRQCREAEIPVFVKQLGDVLARKLGAKGKGDNPLEWPKELRVQQFPSVLNRKELTL